MAAFVETLIVALLVAGSAIFTAWRLTPARRRVQIIDHLAPDTANLRGRFLARLRRKAAAELLHGCGACAGGSPSDLSKGRTGTPGGLRR